MKRFVQLTALAAASLLILVACRHESDKVNVSQNNNAALPEATALAQTTPLPYKPDEPGLPSAFRLKLDQEYPGWEYAPIDQEIIDYYRANNFKGRPDLISGDFDGNGQADYAVCLVYRKEERNFSALVALMASKAGIRSYVLDSGQVQDSAGLTNRWLISLMRKGEKDYDYVKDRDFVYENDGWRSAPTPAS